MAVFAPEHTQYKVILFPDQRVKLATLTLVQGQAVSGAHLSSSPLTLDINAKLLVDPA